MAAPACCNCRARAPTRIGALNFREPEAARYPALGLARDVMQRGGLSGAVFNGAKERALDGLAAKCQPRQVFCADVRAVCEALFGSDAKLAAMEAFAFAVCDPNNAEDVLVSMLTFSTEKEKARKVFARVSQLNAAPVATPVGAPPPTRRHRRHGHPTPHCAPPPMATRRLALAAAT